MPSTTQNRPFILYFLMLFLTVGWGFIGYNFGGGAGAAITVFIALLVNYYAMGIQEEE